MKTLILTLFTMIIFTQAFAGILENRSSGETIEFTLDRSTREIEILSTSRVIPNGVIELNTVKKETYTHDILGLTNWAANLDEGLPVITPVFLVLDLGSMLVRAPIKLLQSVRNKKDFIKLMRAINSTDTITVSNKRFRRIEQLLQ